MKGSILIFITVGVSQVLLTLNTTFLFHEFADCIQLPPALETFYRFDFPTESQLVLRHL
jgi:hypothetical protein